VTGPEGRKKAAAGELWKNLEIVRRLIVKPDHENMPNTELQFEGSRDVSITDPVMVSNWYKTLAVIAKQTISIYREAISRKNPSTSVTVKDERALSWPNDRNLSLVRLEF